MVVSEQFPRHLVSVYCPILYQQGVGNRYGGYETDKTVRLCVENCAEAKCFYDLSIEDRVAIYEKIYGNSTPERLKPGNKGEEIINHILFGHEPIVDEPNKPDTLS